MELTSKTHRLVLRNDGSFLVFTREEPTLTATRVENGEVTITTSGREDAPDKATRDLLAYKASSPLFAAAWDGEGFLIDLDCGFQRWAGWKSTRETCKALRKCGFGNEVPRILKAARRETHSYLGHF